MTKADPYNKISLKTTKVHLFERVIPSIFICNRCIYQQQMFENIIPLTITIKWKGKESSNKVDFDSYFESSNSNSYWLGSRHTFQMSNFKAPSYSFSKITIGNWRKWGYFILFFLIQDRILLYPNLSVYVCETLSWRLELRFLPFTLYKHLYL